MCLILVILRNEILIYYFISHEFEDFQWIEERENGLVIDLTMDVGSVNVIVTDITSSSEIKVIENIYMNSNF